MPPESSLIDERGYAILNSDRASFEDTLRHFGSIIQRERVVLRQGGHGYLSKPGRVPLHTDHPDAALIAWFCEEQDLNDGANLLLDARPVIERLTSDVRECLRHTMLACPPIAGGPPSEARPVLTRRKHQDDLFCSPWLKALSGDSSRQWALDELRTRLVERAISHTIRVRLQRGQMLIVDNRRILHGRDPLPAESKRALLRAWIRRDAIHAVA